MTPRFKSRRRRRRRTAASCATWSSSGQSLQPFSLSRLCLRFSWLWTSSKPLWATESSLSCLQLLRLVLYCNCILCTLFAYPRGSFHTNCVFLLFSPLVFALFCSEFEELLKKTQTNRFSLTHALFSSANVLNEYSVSFFDPGSGPTHYLPSDCATWPLKNGIPTPLWRFLKEAFQIPAERSSPPLRSHRRPLRPHAGPLYPTAPVPDIKQLSLVL